MKILKSNKKENRWWEKSDKTLPHHGLDHLSDMDKKFIDAVNSNILKWHKTYSAIAGEILALESSITNNKDLKELLNILGEKSLSGNENDKNFLTAKGNIILFKEQFLTCVNGLLSKIRKDKLIIRFEALDAYLTMLKNNNKNKLISPKHLNPPSAK